MPEALRQSVLVIDDSPDIHTLIAFHLRPEAVGLLHAEAADDGLAVAERAQPDLILLDLDLAGLSGLDVCRALKRNPDLSMIPVIFLTGTADVQVKAAAFNAGAVDYITKPFDAVELRARVRAALRTKRFQDLLTKRARLDGMTGLANRSQFEERLDTDVSHGVRHGRTLALALIDIDRLALINDQHGHAVGDEVLWQVAQCLQGDLAFRYQGAELALILPDTNLTLARAAAERVRGRVEGLQLTLNGVPIKVTVSIGIASTEHRSDPTRTATGELLANAELALQRAKREGHNRVCLASESTRNRRAM